MQPEQRLARALVSRSRNFAKSRQNFALGPRTYDRTRTYDHRMAREGLGVAQHTYATHWDTLAPLLGGTTTWSLSTSPFHENFARSRGVQIEIQHDPARPSTTQHDPARPSTTQHDPARPSTTQHDPAPIQTRSELFRCCRLMLSNFERI